MAESPCSRKRPNAQPEESVRPNKARRLSNPASASGSSDVANSPTKDGSVHSPYGSDNVMECSQTAGRTDSAPSASLSPTVTLSPLPLESPFTDVLDTFSKAVSVAKLDRPPGGRVNSYIKFHWPRWREAHPSLPPIPPPPRSSNLQIDFDSTHSALQLTNGTSNNPFTLSPSQNLVSPSNISTAIVPLHSPPARGLSTDFVHSIWPRSSPKLNGKYVWAITAHTERPRRIPPFFGLSLPEDEHSSMDRTFFHFYINNWCPGRSVLRQTNAWHEDFAKMEGDAGVRSAMQSLAGVYIYDYMPQSRIVQRINALYRVAENRLQTLLSDRSNLEIGRGGEIITLSCLLSMQDIVRVEYRLKAPHRPRWLRGFELGEYFLHTTDPGSRFWRTDNVQLSSLRMSQSVIVGRAVILAQPLMPLPQPHEFDPEAEAGRFGWLLYGSENHVYEIHGGCGFSRKLLHVLSQVRYCAARLNQEPRSRVVPITAKFLLQEVMEMQQWSSEALGWTSITAGLTTIEWVKAKKGDYVIDSTPEMTEVTAEAWRLASLVYLQCRLLRLPRYHEEVQASLHDLASCINIMPTFGPHFTAQAPLFPVFLLGLLAIDPILRDISLSWFKGVVATPVRSSVPPLFTALTNIWEWIDDEPWAHPPKHRQELADAIKDRDPWWEQLVRAVNDREPEFLCLT